MNKDKIKRVVGELLIMEKYKFIPLGLLSEIIKDGFKELENLK